MRTLLRVITLELITTGQYDFSLIIQGKSACVRDQSTGLGATKVQGINFLCQAGRDQSTGVKSVEFHGFRAGRDQSTGVWISWIVCATKVQGITVFLSFFCGWKIAVSTGVSAMSHEGIELVVRCDMCHGLQR